MSYYKIVKTFDPNDYFIIEGASLEDALYNALMEVGWRCVKMDIDDTMGEINGLLGYGEEQ